MNWYTGNIAEAVNLAKKRNAVFVVYVEGSDDVSKKLTSIINEDIVREKLESNIFVAIKIESETEAYIQFAQIYKLVPLPSIFFIGANGTPIDIVTGTINSGKDLDERIQSIIKQAGMTLPNTSSSNSETNQAGPSTVTVQPTTSSTDSNVVCEDDVCKRTDKTPESSEKKSLEDKMKLAKELLEKKKKDKENEDAKRLKDDEIQRRQVGRDLQSFKERQHEMDLLNMKEERQKDKLADKAARKRILDQIAQDRAEQAHRLSLQSSPSQPIEEKKYVPPKVNADFARIQFRKPDGESEMHTFNASDEFRKLRNYVADSILCGSMRDFILATTFPRKEYSTEDDNKTLSELDLIPSAVILILPNDKSTSSLPASTSSIQPLGMVSSLFWGVIGHMLSIFNYIKGLVWRRRDNIGAQKRANEESQSPNELAKRRNLSRHGLDNEMPSTSSSQPKSSGITFRGREGSNIHRLHDSKDSDDENNTWNGNSTQQQ